MIGHRADGRRTRNETVLIIVPAVIVEIGDKVQLTGITFPKQVLSKNIRDVDLLAAFIELVQIGIGIFLQHVESSDVVLPTIVVVVAENSDPKIGIVE